MDMIIFFCCHTTTHNTTPPPPSQQLFFFSFKANPGKEWDAAYSALFVLDPVVFAWLR